MKHNSDETISTIDIGTQTVGDGNSTFIVAELSANHGQSFEKAASIIEAASAVGADAVKLQTYTPDTITIDCRTEDFLIKGSNLWDGEYLYDLYRSAHMPWEWQPRLKELATDLGLILFSAPFDKTAVDFLEQIEVPAYKIASAEIVDLPLIEYVASKSKPMIISTGMATLDEIEEAVDTALKAGNNQISLLKCTSAYPAPDSEMNLLTIPHMMKHFCVPIGLSDHSQGIAVPIAATAIGASIIEKHLTLSRSDGGPDSAFSLEPDEFGEMVKAIRSAEQAMGDVSYTLTARESANRRFRRSLYIVKDLKKGDVLDDDNVRSIRPGLGLHTRNLNDVFGRKVIVNVSKGTPLSWDLLD